MGFIKFFHQLFHPNCNCNICMAPSCSTCEVLKHQIDYLRYENERLTNTVISIAKPELIEPVQTKEYKPIQTANVPWRVRQQMLEAEDRVAKKLRDEKEKEKQANTLTTEELEKELGIEPEIPPSNAA